VDDAHQPRAGPDHPDLGRQRRPPLTATPGAAEQTRTHSAADCPPSPAPLPLSCPRPAEVLPTGVHARGPSKRPEQRLGCQTRRRDRRRRTDSDALARSCLSRPDRRPGPAAALRAGARGDLACSRTRVEASGPVTAVVVGVHECITAGQPPVRGPSQLQNEVGNCVAAEAGVPTVSFSRSRAPGAAQNFDEATAHGAPTKLNRVSTAARDANRRAALRGQACGPRTD